MTSKRLFSPDGRDPKRAALRRCFAAAIVAAAAVGTLSTHPLAQSRAFAWKATRGQGAVYLVGSVHMLTTDFYPLAPALDAAFKDSDLLVEEADLAEMLSPNTQFSMLSKGMLPAGQTIDKVVTPSTLALINQQRQANGLAPLAADGQLQFAADLQSTNMAAASNVIGLAPAMSHTLAGSPQPTLIRLASSVMRWAIT